MNGNWGASTNLEHLATFETIAMEPGLMRMIVEELDRIVRREFYKKVVKGIEVTRAEVAEELLRCDDADVALGGLVNFLKCKRVENEEREKEKETNETYEVQEAKWKKTDDNYNKIVMDGRLAQWSVVKTHIHLRM